MPNTEIPAAMVELRKKLAHPDHDADDRERLLLSGMTRTLRRNREARQWDGERSTAVDTLARAGFSAREINDLVDDALMLDGLPRGEAIAGEAAKLAILAASFYAIWCALPGEAGAATLLEDFVQGEPFMIGFCTAGVIFLAMGIALGYGWGCDRSDRVWRERMDAENGPSVDRSWGDR